MYYQWKKLIEAEKNVQKANPDFVLNLSLEVSFALLFENWLSYSAKLSLQRLFPWV